MTILGQRPIFKNNNRQRQNKIEREHIRDCSRLAKQSWDENALRYLMRFTAPRHSLAKVYNSRND